MNSVLDVWRAADPDALLVSGSTDELRRPVRGIAATRAAPPHLPASADGLLLVVDGNLVGGALDGFLQVVADAQLRPVAILLAAAQRPSEIERSSRDIPVLASAMPMHAVTEAAGAYLDDPAAHLAELVTSLRLAAAEAALADPDPGAPAGVIAARMRRGVGVTVEGRLRSLHARPAGRALASRFTAAVAHLEPAAAEAAVRRRTRDGLWLLGRRLGSDGMAWLFDDIGFGRPDEAGLEALVVTLRALLRRPVVAAPAAPRRQPPVTGDPLRDTLLAVARANGRVATAARALGVHRNTVLYRLRRARIEQGIDPRVADDALRLLREADDQRTR